MSGGRVQDNSKIEGQDGVKIEGQDGSTMATRRRQDRNLNHAFVDLIEQGPINISERNDE